MNPGEMTQMPTSLNHAAVTFAESLIGAGHVDNENPWSFDAADGNRLLGEKGNDWAQYGKVHLGIHSSASPDTKDRYAYPFAKFKGDTLVLYRSAVAAIRQRAAQESDTEIFHSAGRMMEMMDKKMNKGGMPGMGASAAADQLRPLEILSLPTGWSVVSAASGGEPSSLRIEAEGIVEFTGAKAGDTAADGTPRRPSFSIVGYTGAPMQVAGFNTPIVVDLTGLKADGQEIPVLRGHDDNRIVGQTDSIQIGKDVRLTGTITSDSRDAAEIVTNAKNGFKWRASIGASVLRREFLAAGNTATVNGREVSGPLVIAREAQLYEISFVPIGADNATSASVAASSLGNPLFTRGGIHMTPFDQWVTAKGTDPAALTDGMRTYLQAQFESEQKGAAGDRGQLPVVLSWDQIVAERRAEEQRIEAIAAAGRSWMDRRPGMIDEIDRLTKAAIAAKGTTVDQFELTLLRDTRANAGPAIHSRSTSSNRANGRMIEAAICRTGGLRDLETHFNAETLQASEDRFRHGMGLRDLLMMFARENGYNGYSSHDPEGMLRAAFRRPSLDIQADGFSTFSLSGILSNVANKFMAMGFNAVENAWSQIASRRPVRDFKQVSSYALTGDFTFELLSPTGEIKHAKAGDTTYTNQARPYARMFAIDRVAIINDDLGALTEVPRRIGRGGALKLNDVFWTEFLAGVGSFWASGNNNVSTGAGSALASAGLTAAVLKFRKQTDPDGKPTALEPRLLLVPPELEITADELMTSTAVNTGGSSTETKVPNRNVWTNKFTPVRSTYLSNSAFTNYSTAAWWLLADPADMPTIEVAFLNGREEPTVESADADFDQLGIQMRGYFDFGVSLQEKRASVRSAGS